MKFMGLNEVREKYLSFFESKGHLRLESFPLVPIDDNSLLLINSGMAPLKKYFTGEITPPKNRMTTCQKCIRTPDIERVGKTSRHGTFFEMLGNFSFGDYFKPDATAWAWEFCTKVMELPTDRLWVSIYLEDDEAFEIWTKNVGVSPDKIVRLGKADNFWEIGTGPCGPCSEIYFDRGEKYGCGAENCAVGCDCDRYVEFWNLVFTQFDSDGKGNYSKLAKPNIDTGMGLERLACIMQGVDNLFEVDTIANVIKQAAKVAGVSYKDNEKTDVSLRVIADHIRSTVFLVSDGVLPSNEGRGYVLRRLLRRAARHGRLLGIEKPFLNDLADTVIVESCQAYPVLSEKKEYIKKVISQEEDRFAATIDSGLEILNSFINTLKKENKNTLSGDDAFKLYDTFGFPIDLTKEICEENGLLIDEAKFTSLMNEQKQKARAARAAKGDLGWSTDVLSKLEKGFKTEFVGYDKLNAEAKIVAVVKDGELADGAAAGDTVTIVPSVSPFYAESGGQVGDIGIITKKDAIIIITDTKKTADGKYMLTGTVEKGSFMVGDTAGLFVDTASREQIMRNHSSVHLLQAALRKVLGNHVEQAGSLVDAHRLRFDFAHFSALTPEELKAVETEVNNSILKGISVEVKETDIDNAKKMGAMALFGEKYGNIVRVVKMGDTSCELCGGTHLDNTAKAGIFKIISESSVAAGVRRIEAVTGLNVLKLLSEKEQLIDNTAAALKSNTGDIVKKAEQIILENRELSKQLEKITGASLSDKASEIIDSATEIDGLKVATASIDNIKPDDLRTLCDDIKSRAENIVAVVSGTFEGKLNFCAVCGKEAVAKGVFASNLVKEAAKVAGGGGGGRPDGAMAGGKDLSKIKEALETIIPAVQQVLK